MDLVQNIYIFEARTGIYIFEANTESDVFIDSKVVNDFKYFQKISLVNTTFPMSCLWYVDVYNISVNVVHPSITCLVETPFFG